VREGLAFPVVGELIGGALPYPTLGMVRGAAGAGKSILGAQFALEGLRRGEAALLVACEQPSQQVLAALARFGFNVHPYQVQERLAVLEYLPEHAGPRDWGDVQEFLYLLDESLRQLPRPCRVVVDSMSALAVYYPPSEFLLLVYAKNRYLRRAGLAGLDLYLAQHVAEGHMYTLLNAYDLFLDLYFPEEKGDIPRRYLRLRKVRAAPFDARPYPYLIRPGQGLVLEADFYAHG